MLWTTSFQTEHVSAMYKQLLSSRIQDFLSFVCHRSDFHSLCCLCERSMGYYISCLWKPNLYWRHFIFLWSVTAWVLPNLNNIFIIKFNSRSITFGILFYTGRSHSNMFVEFWCSSNVLLQGGVDYGHPGSCWSAT